MEQSTRIWILAGIAAVFNIASIVLNVVFASSIANVVVLTALRVLLFVAFALSLVATLTLAFFAILYARKLNSRSLGLSTTAWPLFGGGVTVSAASLIVTGVTLVWLVIRQASLPKAILEQPPMAILGVWFALWAVSMILQITVYTLLGLWTRQVLKIHSVGRLDLDFGIHLPPMDELRPTTRDSNRSFQSQDLTLNSPPRTPTSRRGSSTRHSSSTRVGPGSSRTKLVQHSNRSSLDLPAFPANEALCIDSAFDSWDTSSVHREMRAAVHSSPPTRSGLETIPGSRPESPANALDGPFLPSSPTLVSSPHAASSDTATALGWDPSSSSRAIPSTPPSSPPNFSRPTSSSQNRALSAAFEGYMQELIHPLFRPNSPLPPPVAGTGSMVTASPMAETPITPKTLAKLRSSSVSYHWRAMPSIDKSDRPSTAGSMTGSAGPGSPGPSIVEEEDLPPILPGFVLSAGQRTSLVGYGKRKSLKKERPKSQLSAGSRLSTQLV